MNAEKIQNALRIAKMIEKMFYFYAMKKTDFTLSLMFIQSMPEFSDFTDLILDDDNASIADRHDKLVLAYFTFASLCETFSVPYRTLIDNASYAGVYDEIDDYANN